MGFNRELSVRMKDGTVFKGNVKEILPKDSASLEDPSAYLLNSAAEDQYMGVMTEESFKEEKYRPFAEYGVGRKRAEEIWQAVERMAKGENCSKFMESMTLALDVDRDAEGGAVDKV